MSQYAAHVSKSKYNSRAVIRDGLRFDSLAEAHRWDELKALATAREIHDLEAHPRYVLQEGFRDRTGCWQRPIVYEADFAYRLGHEMVVEDVKGVATPVWALKRKMFLKRYPEYKLEVRRL